MAISVPVCERCGGESACSKQEAHVLGGNVCPGCRKAHFHTVRPSAEFATEGY